MMDFVMGLPRTKSGHNVIWVIVDRLTKSLHFLAIRITDMMDKLAKLYIKEVVRLYGISISVISYKDSQFKVLRKLLASSRYDLVFQHSFLTPYGWPIKENHLDPKRHAMGLRYRMGRKLG